MICVCTYHVCAYAMRLYLSCASLTSVCACHVCAYDMQVFQGVVTMGKENFTVSYNATASDESLAVVLVWNDPPSFAGTDTACNLLTPREHMQ